MVLIAFALTGWSLHRTGEAEASAAGARAAAKEANDRLDRVVDWNDVVAPCHGPESLDDCWNDWMRLSQDRTVQLKVARNNH